MTPAELTFLAVMSALGNPAPCMMPSVDVNPYYVQHNCQDVAQAGNRAMACYNHVTQTIILPMDSERLLTYEMARHVTEACLHKPFNQANDDWRIVLEEMGL